MEIDKITQSVLKVINDGEFKNRIRSTIFKNILINLI